MCGERLLLCIFFFFTSTHIFTLARSQTLSNTFIHSASINISHWKRLDDVRWCKNFSSFAELLLAEAWKIQHNERNFPSTGITFIFTHHMFISTSIHYVMYLTYIANLPGFLQQHLHILYIHHWCTTKEKIEILRIRSEIFRVSIELFIYVK